MKNALAMARGVRARTALLAMCCYFLVGLLGATSAHAGDAPSFLESDGTLDPTFSDDGVLTTESAGGDGEDLVVQPDGKIVVVGGNNASDFALARFNPDGTLDPTFGAGGKLTTDFGSSDEARAVGLQPDGKLVVAGVTGAASDFALARYNADGSLDTTFAGDGTQVTSVGPAGGLSQGAYGLAIQPDGKMVVAGANSSSTTAAGDSVGDSIVVRYLSDGSLDAGFADNGIQTIDFGGPDSALDVAVQSDGRIMFVGASDSTAVMARLEPTGALDPSFSDDGRQTIDFGGLAVLTAVALQPDDKIVVAGQALDETESGDFAIARLTAGGALDPTFSEDGRQRTDFPSEFGNDGASDVALQPNGKLVVVGGSSGDFALARYTGDGSLDPAFSGDGRQLTPSATFGGGSTEAAAVALQPDGKIVAAGGNTRFAVARYATGGPVDTTPPQTSINAGPADGSTIGDRTPTFEFSSSEAGSSFRCRIDGGAEFGCASPFTTGELADGQHSFSVVATDAAGNTDATPATRSFTVSIPQDPGPQDPGPQDPAPQDPTPQPPAPQPTAPVQSGPPVEGDPGYTYPAKLRVGRARVLREDRALDVFAPVTSRGFGEEVDVAFRAAGRTGQYKVEVTSGDAAFDRIRFRRTITRAQADLGTGIVTISYPGNEVTRPQEVRLRAARNHADLKVEEISLQGDRLSAQGALNDEARGVVRLELSYLDVQGTPQVFKTNVKIDDGKWSVDNVKVPPEIASHGAYVSVLFTGYFERRIRGEMISYEINPGQTRNPD